MGLADFCWESGTNQGENAGFWQIMEGSHESHLEKAWFDGIMMVLADFWWFTRVPPRKSMVLADFWWFTRVLPREPGESGNNQDETCPTSEKHGFGWFLMVYTSTSSGTGRIGQQPSWNVSHLEKAWFWPIFEGLHEYFLGNRANRAQTLVKVAPLRKCLVLADFWWFTRVLLRELGESGNNQAETCPTSEKHGFGWFLMVYTSRLLPREPGESGTNLGESCPSSKKHGFGWFLMVYTSWLLPREPGESGNNQAETCPTSEKHGFGWFLMVYTSRVLPREPGESGKNQGLSCLADQLVYFAWTFSTSWFIST